MARGLVADRSADVSVAELGLRRMGVLLNELGNPQRNYRTLHIAGSKGKGTTTYLGAAVLSAAGLRTGRYVSPHLFRWNERIAIDGLSISDNDFADVLGTVDDRMARIERTLPELRVFNAFELLTAAAFLHFAENDCDAAVIEVGLGGRFDSTNHLSPVATILTTIENEHADILGPDLATIAWNKAGIMRGQVPSIVQRQANGVLAVLEREGRQVEAPLLLEGRDWSATGETSIKIESNRLDLSDLHLSLPGSVNASNLGAALIAIQEGFAEVKLASDLVNRAVGNLPIPGRFSIMRHPRTGQVFVLDGAHTVQSLHALGRAVQTHFGIERTTYVVNMLDDKPLDQVFEVIHAFADEIVLPPVASKRSAEPSNLFTAAMSDGSNVRTPPSLSACLASIRPDGQPVIVTGSFGLVSEAISILSDPTAHEM